MNYATAQAFERALSDRLKRQAAEEGVDLDRLRKRVAFERFLARPFEAEAQDLELVITNIKDAHETVEDYVRALAEQ